MAATNRQIALTIKSSFDAKGAQAAVRAMKALIAAAQQTGKISPLADPFRNIPKSVPPVYKQLPADAQKAEAAILRLANANARLAQAEGDPARAADILARSLERVDRTSVAAINTQTRLTQVQARLASGASNAAGRLQVLPRTIAGLSNEMAAFAKAAAGAFVTGQITQFTAAAIQSANTLEDAKTSLSQIAGSQELYNRTLEIAAQQQRLFGGTLASNVEDLSAFIISSRTTGVEMEKLISVAQRLAALDPGQGIAGANVALRELLSGNEKSLAMRFELPAAALKALGDESLTATQRVDMLSAFLDSVGLTAEATTAKLNNQSQTYRDLAAAGDALMVSLGQLAAAGFAPAARGAAEFAQYIASSLSHITEYGERLAAAGANIVQSSDDYAEYSARVDELNAMLPPFVARLEKIPEAAFEAAKGLQESGAGAAEVAGVLADTAGVAEQFGAAMDVAAKAGPDAAAGLDALGGAVFEVAEGSDAGAAAMEQLLFAFSEGTASSEGLAGAITVLQANQEALGAANDDTAGRILTAALAMASGQISAEDLQIAIDNLMLTQDAQTAATEAATGATDDNTAASDANTGATDVNTAATEDNIAAKLLAGIEAEILAQRERELMDAAYAAASGQGSAEQAAASLAVRFGIAYDEALRLINALRQLSMMKGPGTGAASALTGVGKGFSRPGQAAAEEVRASIPRGGSGGRPRGGGGGGAAAKADAKRAQEAQRAAEQLTDIQERAAERIEEINQQAAEKLIEIDRKSAEERARIAQDLADDIAATQANQLAEQEANDLDLIGETDKKKLKELEARERAEADARQRMADAAVEAERAIAEATTEEAAAAAEAKYEAQKDYIDGRQQLDEEYYKKQAELAGNEEALAALETEYQEAVDALETARDTELAIEQAKIEAKARLREEEKAKILEDAQAQKDAVVAAAQEQAEKVKGASDAQRRAVVDALGAQRDALVDWAAETEKAANRVATAYAKAADAAKNLPAPPATTGGDGGGGGGATAAAGGGSFVTQGKTTLTVGDNPGGVELVSVVPLSGRGSTRVGGNMARMGDGGTLAAFGAGGMSLETTSDALRLIQQAAERAGLNVEAIEAYIDAVGGAVDLLQAVDEIARQQESPAPPLDPAVWQRLAADAQQVLAALDGTIVPVSEETVDAADRYADAVSTAAGILLDVADLAAQTQEIPPPINVRALERLAADSQRIGAIVGARLLRPALSDLETLGRYAEAVGASVEILQGVADLARQTAAPAPPINEAYLTELAAQSQRIGAIVGGAMLRPALDALETLRRYTEAVTQAVAVLREVDGLRRDLGAPAPPLNSAYIAELAREAQAVAFAVARHLVVFTEATQADLFQYADNITGAVAVLRDVAGLRADLAEVEAPIPAALLVDLAQEAQRAALIVARNLFVFSEAMSADLALYAQNVTAAVSVLRDMAGLRQDAEGATAPITEETLIRLADEAKRAAVIVRARLLPTTEAQAAALEAYAGAVSNSVRVLSDVAGLSRDMFTDYRSPTDAQLNLLATDAQRIARAFERGAQILGAEGAEAVAAYGDALGSVFGASLEGLRTIDALDARDYTVDPATLRQFETSGTAILATAGRLGVLAQAVPAERFEALAAAGESLATFSGGIAALQAVPFDNLGAINEGLGQVGLGGGAAPMTVYVTVNAAPGQNVQQIADAVIGRINSQIAGRR